MFRQDRRKTVLTSILCILVGMLVVWAFASGSVAGWFQAGGPSSAQAAAAGPSTASFSESPDDHHLCTSVGVAVYPARIHVECSSPAPGGISFFALATSNSSHAARVLSVLSMGHVTGKPLWISYDAGDTSGEAIGCLASDCRLIDYVTLAP